MRREGGREGSHCGESSRSSCCDWLSGPVDLFLTGLGPEGLKTSFHQNANIPIIRIMSESIQKHVQYDVIHVIHLVGKELETPSAATIFCTFQQSK